jgi:opacity protein-like surface antigen
MKPLKYFSLIFAFIVLFQCSSNAQLKILLGPAIGLTTPTVDYTGETTDYYSGTKYGLRSAINFGAMGKVSLGPINFNLSAIYSPLSNDGVSQSSVPNSKVEIKQNLFTIGLGTQFGFDVPMSPVKPYVGLELLFTTISGSTKFQNTTTVTNPSIDMETASRTGLGFSAGAEIKILSMALDVSLRYNLINLFSKSYEGPINATNRDEVYKHLNDGIDPQYAASSVNHPVGDKRTIATIQFELGVLFGF